jgi:hypothetical protein
MELTRDQQNRADAVVREAEYKRAQELGEEIARRLQEERK